MPAAAHGMTVTPMLLRTWNSLSASLHSGVHSPQLVGQSRSIESGFSSHSPAVAHAPQEGSVSLHVCVQMPQDRGHSIAMNFCRHDAEQLSGWPMA